MKNRNAAIAIILVVALILGFAFGGQSTTESGVGVAPNNATVV
jgi:hypothetical protein